MAKKRRKRKEEEPGLSPLGALIVIIIIGVYSVVQGAITWAVTHPLETTGIVALFLAALGSLSYMLYKKLKFNVLSWFYGGLKNLWDVYVLKKQPSFDSPTQNQTMGPVSGGSIAKQFQANHDIILYGEQQKSKGRFDVYERAYIPLYDEMLPVIQRVENFNEKIKFDALHNIYGKTAWTLMESRFRGPFEKFSKQKIAYEVAYEEGLNKFITILKAQLKEVSIDVVAKDTIKQIKSGSDCGDALELFKFVLQGGTANFLNRILLNSPESGLHRFGLFANAYITSKADFSNRCAETVNIFKSSREFNEIMSKHSELVDLLYNTRQELGKYLEANVERTQ